MSFNPRIILSTAIPFADLVASLAQAAPIPGLQPAAQAVANMLKLLEGRYENDEAFKRLLEEACELIAALDGWSARPETERSRLDAALATAFKALNKIQKQAKKQANRSVLLHIIFSKDEAKDIAEWQRQLKHAKDVFEITSHLSLQEQIHLLKCTALAGLMREYIVPTASYDTSDKDNAIRCLDTTREALLKDLANWVLDVANPQQFVWLTAPAGGGKTAVCRTFCQQLDDEGIAIASYFFFKSSGRSSISKFVATLAYRIARCDQRARATLHRIATSDEDLFNTSLKTQFNKILLPTLRDISHATQSRDPSSVTPLLILIDGLDECDDKPERTELLEMFRDTLPRLSPAIKVIVSSREESDLKSTMATFDQTHIRRESIKPDDDDIRTILSTKFESIRSTHNLREYLPPDWPQESQFEKLVTNSSGYPIFATVAMEHVRSGSGGPEIALEHILGWTRSEDQDPLARLNDLYRSILKTARRPSLLRKVLELMVFFQQRITSDWPPTLTNQLAADILLDDSTLQNKNDPNRRHLVQIDDVLLDTPSLISVKSLDNPPVGRGRLWKQDGAPYLCTISFFHKSFSDFLFSEPPDSIFFINLNKCAEEIVLRCSTLLGDKEFLTGRFYRSFDVPQYEAYGSSERYGYHQALLAAAKHLSRPGPISRFPNVHQLLRSYDFADLDVPFAFERCSLIPILFVQYSSLIAACKGCPDLLYHFRMIARRCLVDVPGFRDDLNDNFRQVLIEIEQLETPSGPGF